MAIQKTCVGRSDASRIAEASSAPEKRKMVQIKLGFVGVGESVRSTGVYFQGRFLDEFV